MSQSTRWSLAGRGALILCCLIGLWVISPKAEVPRPSTAPISNSVANALQVFPATLTIEQACLSDTSAKPSPVVAPASAPETGDGPAVAISPFRRVSDLAAGAGVALQYDWPQLAAVGSEGSISIPEFPLTAGIDVPLSLSPFTVFDESTEFLAVSESGETPVNAPQVALFRGEVAGEPGSDVFLGVSPHGLNGYIRRDTLTYILSSGPANGSMAASSRCIVAPLGLGFRAQPEELFCQFVPDDMLPLPEVASATVDSLEPMWRRCLLLVECDYDYFKRLGSDLDVALGYAAILTGAASEIFERDIGVTLWLNVARVWTTVQDPYVTCGLYGLEEFRNYGNVNLLDKTWNIAHRMTGCGGGGSGYYSGLCAVGTERTKNAYSISTILGYFPYPALSDTNTWDLFLVCHELGHNFGSPHTHCYAPPIDRCNSDEGGCYAGLEVCDRGTIMSYCFKCRGMADIDLRFHPRVVSLIQSNVAASCLPVVGNGIRITNTAPEMMHVDSIRSTADWLTVGARHFLVAGGASRVVATVVDWSKLAGPSSSAAIHIYSTIGGASSVNMVPVTAIRKRPYPEFEASADSGCWPLVIEFTDKSTLNPIAWDWNFGDGSKSTLQNPVHTYQQPGDYKVQFRATNGCGPQDLYHSFSVHVTEAGLCCHAPPVLIERYDSVAQAYDLWACNQDAIGDQSENTYEIAYVDEDSCGVSVSGNRYLSLNPKGGWYGQTWMRYRATDRDGCICENQVSLIVNDPPQIHLLNPAAGVDTINGDYDILWTDSDRDENARINLFFTAADVCTGGVKINGSDVFEDKNGGEGIFRWPLHNLPDGYYRIYGTITDVFTTNTDCSPGIVLIDRTAPVTVATMTCTQLDAEGWCDGEVRVDISATDTLTGVATTYYSLNGAPDQVYTGPFMVALEGATTLDVYSVDRAGNEETHHRTSQPIRVDTSPPIISGMEADNNRFVAGDFTSTLPTFSIQLTDAGAGVAPAHSIVTITPGAADGPLVFEQDSAGYQYDPITRRISVEVERPLLPGHQVMAVLITDLLNNSATASLDFTIGTSLEMLDVVNNPNPFVRETWFTFKLTEAADITIRIYDLSGELMRTLSGINGQVGYNEIHWDGLSQSGLSLANGAYFYEIVARAQSGTVRHLDKLAILR